MRDYFSCRTMFYLTDPIHFPSLLQFIKGSHPGLSKLPNSDGTFHMINGWIEIIKNRCVKVECDYSVERNSKKSCVYLKIWVCETKEPYIML